MKIFSLFRFDFFLIMSQNVFTKLDFWLADELRKRGKNFIFVRTHIDITVLKQQRIKKIKIEEKNEQGEITEEMKALMEKVRGECVEGLEIRSEEKNQIFIISNWHSDMFEFSKLVVAISSDLSELQRETFLYSTRTETKEIYEAKKKALKKRIIFVSFCSGVAGAVPIPGSSLVVDTSLVMREIKFYKAQFNLDDPSFNTTIKYRPEASGLLKAIATIGTKAYVLRVVGKSIATSILEETAKIFSWFTLGAASAVLGLTSYGSAYYILTRELDKIADLSNQLLDLKLEVMMKKT